MVDFASLLTNLKKKEKKFLTSFPHVPNTTIMHPSAEAILSDPCNS